MELFSPEFRGISRQKNRARLDGRAAERDRPSFIIQGTFCLTIRGDS